MDKIFGRGHDWKMNGKNQWERRERYFENHNSVPINRKIKRNREEVKEKWKKGNKIIDLRTKHITQYKSTQNDFASNNDTSKKKKRSSKRE